MIEFNTRSKSQIRGQSLNRRFELFCRLCFLRRLLEPGLEQKFRHNPSIDEENRLLTWQFEDTHSNLSVGSLKIPRETSETDQFLQPMSRLWIKYGIPIRVQNTNADDQRSPCIWNLPRRASGSPTRLLEISRGQICSRSLQMFILQLVWPKNGSNCYQKSLFALSFFSQRQLVEFFFTMSAQSHLKEKVAPFVSYGFNGVRFRA